jgi:hypothetical protein
VLAGSGVETDESMWGKGSRTRYEVSVGRRGGGRRVGRRGEIYIKFFKNMIVDHKYFFKNFSFKKFFSKWNNH